MSDNTLCMPCEPKKKYKCPHGRQKVFAKNVVGSEYVSIIKENYIVKNVVEIIFVNIKK